MISLLDLLLGVTIATAPSQAVGPAIDSTAYPAHVAMRLPPGRIISRVTSEANRRQTYALYLPTAYRADQTWPLLILMDPRGRALRPLELAGDAAERLGYMVISSYGSRSDEAVDPNADALNAIISDAEQYLALDRHRLYLAGFSGTARVNWIFGYRLRGYVAGLIGFGAGFPGEFTLTHRAPGERPPLVYFGGAGTTDFNFDELRRVDSTLEAVNLPHRVAWYDGPHRWAPRDVMTEAIEWMELQAMRFGLRPVDTAWAAASYQQDLDRAATLRIEAPYQSYLRYRSIVADYDGVRETGEARTNVTALKDSKPVRQAMRQLARIAEQQQSYTVRLATFLADFRQSNPIEPLAKAVERLQIRELQRRAANSHDPMDALAAQRALEHVTVYTSFYEPEEYFEKGDPTRALAILDIAAVVQPEEPAICYSRARALAALGRPTEAVTALGCFARATWARAERLEQDPNLAPLRAEPGFKELLARLRARAPSDSIS